MGQYASLDFSWDDQAYIAYYDAGLGHIKYAYYGGIGNCGQYNQWICTTIDSVGDVGLYASLKAPQYSGDLLRVAYYDPSWGPVVVDNMGTSLSPMGISMDIDKDGYPVIAYQQYATEFSPATLRIVRPYLVFNDNSLGNCGDVPPGYLFQYWHCSTLDNSGQYTEEADFVPCSLNRMD
jgi:hypothetical protein